ncbi:MAG: NfeD family protein [Firmicutes bacterium]|jgi:membrane protein implicated in regulation of membrane protease activity|nr:NfeD family protein [Bacillota bacterium]
MPYQPALNRLIGQSGIVMETIPPERTGAGVIKVAGQLWSAETDWPMPLAPGTHAMVVDRSSLVLVVLPEKGGDS